MERMTENELLEELAREFGLAERLPGDVDAFMLQKTTGKSINACREFLKAKVAVGELIALKVQGDHGNPVTVYRKAKLPLDK